MQRYEMFFDMYQTLTMIYSLMPIDYTVDQEVRQRYYATGHATNTSKG